MKNIWKYILALSFFIIALSVGYYFVIFLPYKDNRMSLKIDTPSNLTSDLEAKKKALADYYSKISLANANKDYGYLYDIAPKLLKDNITRQQYIDEEKANASNKVYSTSTTVNKIVVDGNKGTVYRTIVTCLTKECLGEKRQVDDGKKDFEYVNGKWQAPDIEPSERSLKAASYIYLNESAADQSTFIDNWGYGSKNSNFAIDTYAIYLDSNPDKLVYAETWIDKNKADRSRPIYNYQPPAIIEQPVIQQQYHSTNCTSNTIGNYTYTNCY